MKSDWLPKHFHALPSVVVLITPFNISWQTAEWVKNETALQENYQRLKFGLYPRDVRIIVVAVKQQSAFSISGHGAAGGGGEVLFQDKEVLEERLSSMKRHLQIDSKFFMFLTPSDFVPTSAMCKKLCKTIRETSMVYYATNGKRLKVIAKSITTNKQSQYSSVLIARFFFKVAFYFEILNQQMSHSLKYYRTCFDALMNLAELTAISSSGSMAMTQPQYELMEQVKVLAEWVNYKICKIQFNAAVNNNFAIAHSATSYRDIFSAGSAGGSVGNMASGKKAGGAVGMNPHVAEACQQFRQHVAKFGAIDNAIGVYGLAGGIGGNGSNAIAEVTEASQSMSLRSHSSSDTSDLIEAVSNTSIVEELPQAVPLLWRHYAWMADQYLIFLQLLDHFKIDPKSNVDTDRYNYYYNAYKFTRNRYLNFTSFLDVELRTLNLKLGELETQYLNENTDSLEEIEVNKKEIETVRNSLKSFSFLKKYQENYVVISTRYVGELLTVMEPPSANPGASHYLTRHSNSNDAIETNVNNLLVSKLSRIYSGNDISNRKYYHLSYEIMVHHVELQKQYLSSAISNVSTSRKRMCSFLTAQYGDLHMHTDRYHATTPVYDAALKLYLHAIDLYISEEWHTQAVAILRKAFLCAKYLGDLPECLNLGLKLYACCRAVLLRLVREHEYDKDGGKIADASENAFASGSGVSSMELKAFSVSQMELAAKLQRQYHQIYGKQGRSLTKSYNEKLVESMVHCQSQLMNASSVVDISKDLHKDILSMLYGKQKPLLSGSISPVAVQTDAVKSEEEGYIEFACQPEFGHGVGTSPKGNASVLPDGLTFDFCGNSNLFATQVWFDRNGVELANYVRVNIHLTSLMRGQIIPTELYVHYSNSIIIQHFVHNGANSPVPSNVMPSLNVGVIIEGGDDPLKTAMQYSNVDASIISEPAVVGTNSTPTISPTVNTITKPIPACLIFDYNVPVILSTLVYFPEDSLSNQLVEAFVCVDLVKMVIHLPKSVENEEEDSSKPCTPSEQIALEGEMDSVPVDGEDDVRASFIHQRATFVEEEEMLQNLEGTGKKSFPVSEDNQITPLPAASDTDVRGVHATPSAVEDGAVGQTSDIQSPVAGMSLNDDLKAEDPDVTSEESKPEPPSRVQSDAELSQIRADISCSLESESEMNSSMLSVASPISSHSPVVVEDEETEQAGLREALERAMNVESPLPPFAVPNKSIGNVEPGTIQLLQAGGPEISAQTDILASLPNPATRKRLTSFSLINGVEKIDSNGSDGDSEGKDKLARRGSYPNGSKSSGTVNTKDRDYKRIILDISCFSTDYIAEKLSLTKPVSTKDLCKFVGGPYYNGNLDYKYNTTAAVGGVRKHKLELLPPLYVHTNNNLFEITRAPPMLHLTRPNARIVLVSPLTTAESASSFNKLKGVEPVTNSATPVCIVQGVVQRINLVFFTGADHVRFGKCYVTSDYASPGATSSNQFPAAPTNTHSQRPHQTALFWYPDLAKVDESLLWKLNSLHTCKDDQKAPNSRLESLLDSVEFHPLRLDPNTNQPAAPFMLPLCDPNSMILVPVYVKAEMLGAYTIKAKIEYIPNERATIPVQAEFEVKVSVQKAVSMIFQIGSNKEVLRGIVPLSAASNSSAGTGGTSQASVSGNSVTATSTVLRGDSFPVYSTLSCVLNPSGDSNVSPSIELLDMKMVVKPNIASPIAAVKNASNFSIFSLKSERSNINSDASIGADEEDIKKRIRVGSTSTDLLQPILGVRSKQRKQSLSDCSTSSVSISNTDGVELHSGETVQAVVDVMCNLESATQGGSSASVSSSCTLVASVGHITAQWRLRDYSLFADVPLPVPPVPVVSENTQTVHTNSAWWSVGDCYYASRKGKEHNTTASSSFPWLLPLSMPNGTGSGTPGAPFALPVDEHVTISRKCSIMFPIPYSQV